MRWLTHMLPLTFCAGILGACASGSAELRALQSETRTLFEAVYAETDENYLEPLNAQDFTLAGLRGLSSLDPDFEVTASEGKFSLWHAGEPIQESPTPANSASIREWARFASTALTPVWKSSETINTAAVDEIHAAFLDSALLTLDRFSRYADPSDAAEQRAEREGFGGIGVDIENHANGARVQDIEPERPAAQAGLSIGDIITRINGELLEERSLSEIKALLRGPLDTAVDLVIVREGLPAPWPVTVGRTRIVPNTVFYEPLGAHALIRISGFNNLTSKRLAEVMSQARAELGEDLDGVILDLRGNLGGLLDQAVVAADLFLDEGLITRADGRHPNSHQRFAAETGDIAKGLDLVVLINGASASAAEILASALQDNGRAVVIGMSSFGKGSIQNVIQLPNEGELYVTWAHFVAPSGYALDRMGVMPTLCTSAAGDAVDALEKAMADASKGESSPLTERRMVDPKDEDAVRRILSLCPWTPHQSGDIDLAISELLLGSPALMQEALSIAKVPDGA